MRRHRSGNTAVAETLVKGGNKDQIAFVGGLRQSRFKSDAQRRAFGHGAEKHEANHHLDIKTLRVLHRKVVARAYSAGGKDFEKSFAWMDKDRSGSLDMHEFVSALKRMVKLTADDTSCLRQVFDANMDGQVEFSEFMAFVNTKRSDLAKYTNIDADSPLRLLRGARDMRHRHASPAAADIY